MNRPVPAGECGAALLAVLLLVAVTGAIAALAMERMSLSRAAAMNHVALDQARGYAEAVGQLAILTLDDARAREIDWAATAMRWNGALRRVPLPGGGIAEARVRDGGNCFNINSVVAGDARTGLVRRPSGVRQFAGLMHVLGVPAMEAASISEAAADWADSDSETGPGGAEDPSYAGQGPGHRTANTHFADVGELRSLRGMRPGTLRMLRPWLCALPTSDLSPINVNSLAPDQAALLAMLDPGRLSIEQARLILARRPASGWTEIADFWRIEAMRDSGVPLDIRAQLQVRPSWFLIETRVELLDAIFLETLLVDARLQRTRIVQRRWG